MADGLRARHEQRGHWPPERGCAGILDRTQACLIVSNDGASDHGHYRDGQWDTGATSRAGSPQ